MKAIGVIPARLGSTRFPGKPLAEFFGKTMIEHTYAAAAEASSLSKVVVTTDSHQIARVIDKAGGSTVITGDCATGTDRIVQALQRMDPEERASYDIVVNIQGDEPGVNPKHIDLCVAALRSDPACVMSTLATPILHERDARSRDVVKCVINQHNQALYFSRAMIPHSKDGAFRPDSNAYLRHVGLYAFRTDFLLRFPSLPKSPLEEAEDLEQLRVLSAGHSIKIVRVEDTLPGVDTQADLQALQARWAGPRT